jgi:MFS transporter, SET family, sugar efflux transporter
VRTRFVRLLRIPHFAPLAIATLMLGVALSFSMPYLSLFGVEEAAMSPMRLGVFMTVVSASGVYASSAVGRWSDRHRRYRAPLIASLVVAAIGYASLSFFRGFAELMIVGLVLLGPGSACLSQIFSFGRAALGIQDPAQDEFASAALRTLLSVAWVFGPAIGALILAQAGFEGLFVFAAASFAASALIAWRIAEARADARRQPSARDEEVGVQHREGDAHRTEHPARKDSHPVSRSPLDPYTRKTIARVLVALTLIGLAANATMILLPLYMIRQLHGTRLMVSAALGAGALLEIPMMLWLGAKSSRLRKPRWLTASAVMHAVYFVALALLSEPLAVVPLQVLPASVVAVTSCLGMTYIQDLMPGETGAATARFFNAWRIGAILSGVMSGMIVGAFGYRTAFLLCAALALCAFLLLSFDVLTRKRSTRPAVAERA